MKSPEEIVEFIDLWISHSLNRPEMYASSPEALEGTVILLEDLRSFIVEQEPSGPFRLANPYVAYLVAHGYGSGSFTSTRGNHTFNDLITFLSQYLISQGRPHHGECGMSGHATC